VAHPRVRQAPRSGRRDRCGWPVQGRAAAHPDRLEVRPSHVHDLRHAHVSGDRTEGSDMTEIAGKAAVVTGGGSGIGMGLAKELAAEGAAVAVADIIFDNAVRVAEAIKAAGGKAV